MEIYSVLDVIFVLFSYGYMVVVKENVVVIFFSFLIVEDYCEVVGKYFLVIFVFFVFLCDVLICCGKKDVIKVSLYDYILFFL